MADTTVLFGPPGTGKTTRLLSEIQTRMASGLAPEEICFASFSNNAVDEMVSRAGLRDEQRPYWSTIHSLGKQLMGLRRNDIADSRLRRDFARSYGHTFDESQDQDMLQWEDARDNPVTQMFAFTQLAAARCVSLESIHREYATFNTASLDTMVELHKRWREILTERSQVDFDDLLTRPLRYAKRLPIRLLVLDEAADTSEAQLRLLRHVLPPDCEVIVAGDDDQSIYTSLGASGGAGMLSWGGQHEFLVQSHRIPRNVFRAAQPVIRGCHERVPKPFKPREADGTYRQITELHEYELPPTGSVLVLVRARRRLHMVYEWCRSQLWNFMGHDNRWQHERPHVRGALAYTRLQRGQSVGRAEAEMLRPLLPVPVPMVGKEQREVAPSWLTDLGDWTKRPWFDVLQGIADREREWLRMVLAHYKSQHESFLRAGRVRVTTIHAAKGSEADHVVLLDDMGQGARQRMRENLTERDAELRVRYVGMTRAIESLTTVTGPQPFPV